MNKNLSPIPDGFHTLTPSIVVRDPDAAIAHYQNAFGAEEVMVLRSPDGQIMHAELRIGDSIFMMSGEWPDMGLKAPAAGHTSSSLHIYCDDADRSFQRAVNAGCSTVMPPTDMFWGDRYAKVQDPFGHQWGLATRIEDVSPEECERRAAAWSPA